MEQKLKEQMEESKRKKEEMEQKLKEEMEEFKRNQKLKEETEQKLKEENEQKLKEEREKMKEEMEQLKKMVKAGSNTGGPAASSSSASSAQPKASLQPPAQPKARAAVPPPKKPLMVLACGSVDGSLSLLRAKIKSLSPKPEFALVVGDFMKMTEKPEELQAYLGDDPKETLPVPVYFIERRELFMFDKGPFRAVAKVKGEDRITFLGTCGVRIIHGLCVAFLSGTWDEHFASAPCPDTHKGCYYTRAALNQILQELKGKPPVDIFVSSESPDFRWSTKKKALEVTPIAQEYRSPFVRELLNLLKPRYHITCAPDAKAYRKTEVMIPGAHPEKEVGYVGTVVQLGPAREERVQRPDDSAWSHVFHVVPGVSSVDAWKDLKGLPPETADERAQDAESQVAGVVFAHKQKYEYHKKRYEEFIATPAGQEWLRNGKGLKGTATASAASSSSSTSAGFAASASTSSTRQPSQVSQAQALQAQPSQAQGQPSQARASGLSPADVPTAQPPAARVPTAIAPQTPLAGLVSKARPPGPPAAAPASGAAEAAAQNSAASQLSAAPKTPPGRPPPPRLRPPPAHRTRTEPATVATVHPGGPVVVPPPPPPRIVPPPLRAASSHEQEAVSGGVSAAAQMGEEVQAARSEEMQSDQFHDPYGPEWAHGFDDTSRRSFRRHVYTGEVMWLPKIDISDI
mmetsp:Transcript_37371/g.69592  ORF Transcript_37371/g.69592 Transcript_37371/m.69592 type:complete len:686 (-) Transcript_37371:107-2164(-)